jgi:hypothetical protein
MPEHVSSFQTRTRGAAQLLPDAKKKLIDEKRKHTMFVVWFTIALLTLVIGIPVWMRGNGPFVFIIGIVGSLAHGYGFYSTKKSVGKALAEVRELEKIVEREDS